MPVGTLTHRLGPAQCSGTASRTAFPRTRLKPTAEQTDGSPMGWRDRDYAKWTPEERRRFLGSSGNARGDARSPVIAGGAGLAAAISLGLLVLGQVPSGHPLVSVLHIRLGSQPTARLPAQLPRIEGPTVVQAGDWAVYHGSVPSGGNGQVAIVGSLDGAEWQVLALTYGRDGRYDASVHFETPGLMVVHARFLDGETAAWTVRVLPSSGTTA
jgi:hypothetical protein